ncbi:MAG: FAA hydrolase family protein, partial [Actinomycetota bacterium]|nr:FAA hydrolase family protein [Actinomycetota bacterium]
MAEFRRILLAGTPVLVTRQGDALVAGDGREVDATTAVHLPPV